MTIRVEHELHRRRRSRNLGVGAVLVCFVALVFWLTVVKVQQGNLMEGFDHQPRISLTPLDPAAAVGRAATGPGPNAPVPQAAPAGQGGTDGS